MFLDKKNNCFVKFSDGVKFYGRSIGIKRNLFLEIIFNTSNLGYQEVITDPSYMNQAIVFTTPYIGNTGINSIDCESNRIWASCILVKNLTTYKNTNFRYEKKFIDFLITNNIVIITNLDTRSIVKKITNSNCNFVTITHKKNSLNKFFKKKYKYLSFFQKKSYSYNQKLTKNYKKSFNIYFFYKLCILDFGLKFNILRNLNEIGFFTLVINWKKIRVFKKFSPNGIVLTNGPGDPNYYNKIIKIIKTVNLPMLGICFGHQLISLSKGYKIIEMKFGHHGCNHPILFLNKKFISSQNHNFCSTKINEIYSIFDKTNQGLISKKIISFQGHPEACPGTNELSFIFKKFKNKIWKK
ncbi:carbamoyl phosphate synthase small subunit [Candidatus Vidania fulgoroideorum]